jgi:arylformamidase
MTQPWIDISIPLQNGMAHWPDNPPMQITPFLDMAAGDVCNVSKLSLGSHTGTHMDAPHHFIVGGKSIDAMPITASVGPARVIAIDDPESIKPDELRRAAIQPDERVLFKTRNSPRCWESNAFVEDFVYIAADAAQYLAEVGVQLVGVDYLSVGGFFKDGPQTHQALLGAGIWIIEGLNLTAVTPGKVDLICLPIKIAGGDGAPARAIVRASV